MHAAPTRRALPLAIVMLLLAFEPGAAQTDIHQPPPLPPGFTQSLVAEGLTNPVTMELAPDGRLFVAEKAGRLRIVKNGELLQTPFLSLAVDTFGDGGLVGLALDPSFAQNRFVYVFYSRALRPVRNRVSRFTASSSSPDVAEPDGELVLVDDIPADIGNHNGGALRFGLDGKLYIGVGDGAANPMGAQSLSTLNGKLLRINPDGSIPTDNPFVDEPDARAEIWAYGLRNPFTFAVQPGTGAIFINDVGQGLWEEVNLAVAGANYGWPLCEGRCSMPGLVDPTYVYSHDVGCAIAGGAFYPGGQFPSSYAGAYFFADFMAGWISVLDLARNEAVPFAVDVRGPVDLRIDSDGALYYLSFERGAVYRIHYAGETDGPGSAIRPEDVAPRTFLCVE